MASPSSSDLLDGLTGFLASLPQNDDRYQRMVSGSGSSSQYADRLVGANSLLDVHWRMLPNPPSLASVRTYSTRPTTIAPSQIFSHCTYPSAGSSDISSVTDLADAPELAGQNLDAGPLVLFCEFVGLGECNVSFQQHEFRSWVEHIEEEHLQGLLPESCQCWFCDDVKFKASQNDGNRQSTFYQRMGHIYSHIVDSRYTSQEMRPDFDILKHLHRHRLVDDGMHRRALQFEEGPTVPGIYAHNFIPPEQSKAVYRGQMQAQRETPGERRARTARRPGHQSTSRHAGPSSHHRW